MPRSKSSKRWLKEHFSDIFVKKAQLQGYRSRAVYKLAEIDDRDSLLRPGISVLDLGAAPGGWTQLVCERLKGNGIIVAVDLLPISHLDNVNFILGDFQEEMVWNKITSILPEHSLDLLLSDLAPNMTGVLAVDIINVINLAEVAMECGFKLLKPGGSMLIKLFQGAGFEEIVKKMRINFKKVVLRKPSASRSRSREVYLLAKDYKIL